MPPIERRTSLFERDRTGTSDRRLLRPRGFGRVAVAYSGGIDSTLVLKVAHDELGDNAVGFTAVSASMPHYEQDAGGAGRPRDRRPRALDPNTHEDEDERYLDNPPNRCYFCKTDVYDEFLEVAAQQGFSVLLDGTNADDVGDWRPGRQAAREHGVRSPLARSRLHEGRDPGDRPRAGPFQLGYAVRALPVLPRALRHPHHPRHARPDRQGRVGAARAGLPRGPRPAPRRRGASSKSPSPTSSGCLSMREEIVAALKEAGYTFVALDLSGLKSGSLNLALRFRELWTRRSYAIC